MELEITEFRGLKFYHRPDTVEFKILYHCCGRGEYLTYFDVEPGETWLDIGANIGGFTIYAANRGARVLSCEAMPETFKILEMNVDLNKVNDLVATSEGAVVGSDEKEVLMYKAVSNTGACSMFSNNNNNGETITVPAVNIKKILDKMSGRICIKMDVEGAEVGLIPCIDFSRVDKFTCEYHQYLFKNTPEEELFELTMDLLSMEFPHATYLSHRSGVHFISAWR